MKNVQTTSGLQGLSEAEAIARRQAGQGNNVKIKSSRSVAQILRENLFTFINATFLTISLVLISLGRYGDAFLYQFVKDVKDFDPPKPPLQRGA